MGKGTPGKPKTVRLSQDELRELCQKAVEDGVSEIYNIAKSEEKTGMEGLAIPD